MQSTTHGRKKDKKGKLYYGIKYKNAIFNLFFSIFVLFLDYSNLILITCFSNIKFGFDVTLICYLIPNN